MLVVDTRVRGATRRYLILECQEKTLDSGVPGVDTIFRGARSNTRVRGARRRYSIWGCQELTLDAGVPGVDTRVRGARSGQKSQGCQGNIL